VRVLSILYVTEHRSTVRIAKGNVVVSRPDGAIRVPIESLEAVVLFGGQVTTDALAKCVEHGVRVTGLRRSGRVRFSVSGATSGNVLLRVAQHRAASDESATAAIARSIVAGKLQNYRNLLHRWAWDARPPERSMLLVQREVLAERIRGLSGLVDGDRIRGIEGDGTRRYFKGLAVHLGDRAGVGRFLLRTRRPPRDPVNALLSFLYALVQAELVGAIDAVGLDPQVGFLHGLRSGRASLALDLLEELRPAVADRLAVRLIHRRQLRLEHFTANGAGAWYLADEGRRLVLQAYEEAKDAEVEHRLLGRGLPAWTLPTVQATLLARHLRGDLPAYAPFVRTA
jgi:CRISPR-associated protein Cas1